MKDRVTVQQAIKRGQLTVNMPVKIIIFVGLIVIGLPLAWLYWSYAIPKWKLWAYANVEDIGALKRAAISAGLIWPDNHVFEKTEICSPEMRAQILKLEGRA